MQSRAGKFQVPPFCLCTNSGSWFCGYKRVQEKEALLQPSTGDDRVLEGSLELPLTPTNPKVAALRANSESDFCAAQINPVRTIGQVRFQGTEGLDPRHTISTQKYTQHTTQTQDTPQNFPKCCLLSTFPSRLETHKCNSNQEWTLSTCYPTEAGNGKAATPSNGAPLGLGPMEKTPEKFRVEFSKLLLGLTPHPFFCPVLGSV